MCAYKKLCADFVCYVSLLKYPLLLISRKCCRGSSTHLLAVVSCLCNDDRSHVTLPLTVYFQENFSVALKMLGIGVDGVEECKGIICENDNDPRHNTINIAAASNGTTRSNGVLNGDDHLVTKFRRASLIPEEEDPDDSWH